MSEESVTITVPNVDIELLRNQRDALLNSIEYDNISYLNRISFEGLISMLDAMLDIAWCGKIL